MSEYTPKNLAEVAVHLCNVWGSAVNDYIDEDYNSDVLGDFSALYKSPSNGYPWDQEDEDALAFLKELVDVGIANQHNIDDEDSFIITINKEYEDDLRLFFIGLMKL